MKLNPAQAAVVACRDPRVLVLAGAGAGKTATSVHWVAELIRSGVPRRALLMITFTRKAANEMAARIENLLLHHPSKSLQDKLTVGTYHAVASILLRREAEKFGLAHRDFSTIDESEAQSVWKSALKQCGFTTKSALFVPGRLHEYYSFARNTRTPVEKVLEPHFRGQTPKLLKVIRTYEELKRAANVVDYDDLLVLWAERLHRDADYAARLREQWKYVLVDEMQDNNRLNQAILDGLNPLHLMVVGDANQSIYGFRGSDAHLISEFASRNTNTTILKLENNYRSGQAILDLANEVVKGTPTALTLQSAVGGEAKVEYRTYLNGSYEAFGVIRWLQSRLGQGIKACESAVLARSSRFLTALEIALNQNRIRYKKYGGLTLADAAEVKDFIAFLRITHNSRDKIALLRALIQFPGIGEGTAAKVIAEHEGGLLDNAQWPEAAAELPRWIHTLRHTAGLGAKGRFLQEQIRPLILANYPKDGEERLGTLSALVTGMENAGDDLAGFLDGFTLSRQTNDYHPSECVILSTIHSSKGLEWDGVWLVGAGSTQMPHPRALESGEMDEERRLFYVAVTRAKKHLVVSYPGMNERKQGQQPSPFVPPAARWDYRES
jgi:DNA helicase-2/ATP-dependent DNA helicase PcrA